MQGSSIQSSEDRDPGFLSYQVRRVPGPHLILLKCSAGNVRLFPIL